jgi:hypothetical protein
MTEAPNSPLRRDIFLSGYILGTYAVISGSLP